MKSRTLVQFTNAANVNPSVINENLQGVALDVADAQAQRWCYSSFILDFTGISDTDNVNARSFTITPPWYIEIVGVELQHYDASSAVCTLSASGSGLTGWSDVTTTGAASATTRVYSAANFQAKNTASSSLTFTASLSATSTPAALRAVIHIRTDRFNAGNALTTYSPTLVQSGATTSASALNTEFTNIASAVAADTAAYRQPRIDVICRRNAATTPIEECYFNDPSYGRRIESWDARIVATATVTATWTYVDDGASTLATNAVTGSGATSTAANAGATSGLPAFPGNAPATPANDYSFQLSRSGAGTLSLTYIVLYSC